MRYWILALVLILLLTLAVGCGYRLRGTTDQMVTKMQTIILNSFDPYGPLTRSIRMEMRLNDIILVDDTEHKDNMLPTLRVTNSSENQITISVFQDGKTAKYQMILSVYAQLVIPDKDYYPINIKIYRSFFDNPLTAMAKNAEEDIIRQEMRQQAAQQLVYKLLMVLSSTRKDTNNALNTQLKQLALPATVVA